jgi:hypothetical protein
MTAGQGFERALDLLGRVPRPPEARPCAGASKEQLSALEGELGYPVPASLVTWLSVCNGIVAGPGGLYGSRPADDFLDIGSTLRIHPDWRLKKWLPVAGDGNGNHYVIDAGRTHLDADAVYFVDVSEDALELAYIVGSNLDLFLVFLLDRETGVRGWPFDASYVLAHDPGIASVDSSALLPWNA